jgi:hypothetical protein
MSSSKVRGTRLPNDLDSEFVEYRDEREINDSEAVRNLVRAGLEAERAEGEEDEIDEARAGTGAATQVTAGILALSVPMSTAGILALFLDVGANVTLPVLGAGVFWMAASAVALVAGTTKKLDQLLAERAAGDIDDDQEENGNGDAVATDGGQEL